jgi:hypothetical protein
MKVFFTALLLLASAAVSAQTDMIAPKAEGGVYNRITGGVLTGERTSLSFQFANGYRFGKRFEAGLGLGFESYYGDRYVPLFLETRYNFTKGNTVPFVGAMGGYLAGLNQYYASSRGATVGANIGMTHYFTKHFGVTTVLGFRYTQTEERPQYYMMWPGEMPLVIEEMGRIELRVGIAFR